MIKGARRGEASTTQGGEKEGGLGEKYRYSKAAAAPTCEMPHVKSIFSRLFSGGKTDCRGTLVGRTVVCACLCVSPLVSGRSVGRLVGTVVRSGGLRGGLTGVDYAGF